ncbi:MAG: hypothetical protein J1E02_06555 [Coprobacter sp.]|nr:hypothetical protein [Coprobacter sp.]
MTHESQKYEEWLATIANSRLIYNTMAELEEMMDNRSIHSNGIKRCFSTPQKLRSAFRDLKVEVDLMTNGQIALDTLLMQYRKAWTFFHENLYRRTAPEQIAFELLAYCYPPYQRDVKKHRLYEQLVEQKISVPFILLMLLKAIPGYDSKEGDVIDMPRQYEKVMALLEQFTGNCTLFQLLPAITRAKEESNKTRLMLFSHVSQILDIYESYARPVNMYDASADMKMNRVHLDIAGYWNECGGQPLHTRFWQIENALDAGTYFMTHYRKDADNKLTGIRYTLLLFRAADGSLIAYIQHPEAICHRIAGLSYGDGDHVWYRTGMPDDAHPEHLPFQRMLHSCVWQQDLNLTRCTDEKLLELYTGWKEQCISNQPYRQYEYTFFPNLYAVTATHLYIPAEKDGEYYKIPKSAYEGFDRIQIGDDVGILQMNDKSYLTFDEFLLYIEITESELSRYGIETVGSIE